MTVVMIVSMEFMMAIGENHDIEDHNVNTNVADNK